MFRDAKPWRKHCVAPVEIANRFRFSEPTLTGFLDRVAPSFLLKELVIGL